MKLNKLKTKEIFKNIIEASPRLKQTQEEFLKSTNPVPSFPWMVRVASLNLKQITPMKEVLEKHLKPHSIE